MGTMHAPGYEAPVVEPFLVQDIFATEMVRVDELGGDLMRFVFAVDQMGCDGMEKAVVCKIILHRDCARTSALNALHIIGKLLMRNCVECVRRSCH